MLDGGARQNDDAATVAASFINCHEAPEGFDGRAAAGMWTSRKPPAASRPPAPAASASARRRRPSRSTGARRRAPRRRRRSACASSRPTSPSPSSAPSSTGKPARRGASCRATDARGPDARPALFWSLCSRTDPRGVAFALEHVVSQARSTRRMLRRSLFIGEARAAPVARILTSARVRRALLADGGGRCVCVKTSCPAPHGRSHREPIRLPQTCRSRALKNIYKRLYTNARGAARTGALTATALLCRRASVRTPGRHRAHITPEPHAPPRRRGAKRVRPGRQRDFLGRRRAARPDQGRVADVDQRADRRAAAASFVLARAPRSSPPSPRSVRTSSLPDRTEGALPPVRPEEDCKAAGCTWRLGVSRRASAFRPRRPSTSVLGGVAPAMRRAPRPAVPGDLVLTGPATPRTTSEMSLVPTARAFRPGPRRSKAQSRATTAAVNRVAALRGQVRGLRQESSARASPSPRGRPRARWGPTACRTATSRIQPGPVEGRLPRPQHPRQHPVRTRDQRQCHELGIKLDERRP